MPKVVDHEQRRNDIIDVTWQLIIDGGLEAATMREIASSAGFANGALKHYFPSKDDIIEATWERALALMSEYVTIGEQRGLAALREICWSSMPLDEDRITAGRVLLTFWKATLANPKLREKYLDHLRMWRAQLHTFLQQGRADGDIVCRTPDEELVDEIVLLTAGTNVMSLVGPEVSTIELHKRHLEALFTRLTQL